MKQAMQAGFTLIELVVVIVILGILAAVAIPQFTDLSTQARTAVAQGACGALQSSAVLLYASKTGTGSTAQGDWWFLENRKVERAVWPLSPVSNTTKKSAFCLW